MRSDKKVLMRLAALALLVLMVFTLAGCKKAEEKKEEEKVKEPKNTTAESKLCGKCYVLTGMKSQDEEYDTDLINAIFDIDDPAEYMSVYFKKDGTAYVYSLLYDFKVKEMKWIELDGTAYLEFDDGELEFKQEDDGTITTVKAEEDGDEFTLTLSEAEEIPEVLAKYAE